MKDLPRVFANPIDRNVNNVRTSYGKLSDAKNVRNESEIRDKIEKLFKSKDTIYSIDCIITFENNIERYTIIGRTESNLVTRTQKLIPIKDIYDINLA